MGKESDLQLLLAAASWQDDLLQAYRSLHLTFQSIALAIGVGLIVALVSFDFGVQLFVSLALFWGILILQFFATRRFRNIIAARGRDVNFWHSQIILAEQGLESDRRYLTRFKVYQKLQRQDSSYLQDLFLSDQKISQADVDLLIGKGLGHTRKVIDEQLFNGILLIWALMAIASIILVVYKAP